MDLQKHKNWIDQYWDGYYYTIIYYQVSPVILCKKSNLTLAKNLPALWEMTLAMTDWETL